MVKAWTNKVLSKTKMCLGWKSKVNGGTCSEWRECSWHRVAIVSFEGIVGVMGWRTLATQLYFLDLPKVRQVVNKSSNEWWEWGAREAWKDSSWRKN